VGIMIKVVSKILAMVLGLYIFLSGVLMLDLFLDMHQSQTPTRLLPATQLTRCEKLGVRDTKAFIRASLEDLYHMPPQKSFTDPMILQSPQLVRRLNVERIRRRISGHWVFFSTSFSSVNFPSMIYMSLG
jgi:hypothetical protein